MVKRLLAASMIFFCALSSAFADMLDRTSYGCLYLAPTITYENITSNNVDFEGVTPRLSLGYGAVIPPLFPVYMGIEIYGSPQSLTIHNHKQGTPGLKPSYHLGASLMPGVYLDQVLIGFARLGVVYTHFKNLDATRTGFEAGLGLQARVSDKWDLRGEYDYVTYGKINPLGNVTSGTYIFGAVYKFG